jgi:hypothetical protein
MVITTLEKGVSSDLFAERVDRPFNSRTVTDFPAHDKSGNFEVPPGNDQRRVKCDGGLLTIDETTAVPNDSLLHPNEKGRGQIKLIPLTLGITSCGVDPFIPAEA